MKKGKILEEVSSVLDVYDYGFTRHILRLGFNTLAHYSHLKIVLLEETEPEILKYTLDKHVGERMINFVLSLRSFARVIRSRNDFQINLSLKHDNQ